MGSVWRARDLLLDRTVAAKQLVHAVAGQPRAALRRRALREARALALVDHPSIVTIHDVVYHADDPWLVMRYVPGISLADRVTADGGLPEHTAARIGAGVAGALTVAHREGVLHRDVKPANILLTPRDDVVLVDFGIAAISDERTRLTAPNSMIGTLSYMAPERVSGGAAGPAADVWSLGVTLYQALSGTLPFEGPHPAAIILELMDAAPRTLPGALGELIAAMLARDPDERPAMSAVHARLIVEQPAPMPQSPRSWDVRRPGAAPTVTIPGRPTIRPSDARPSDASPSDARPPGDAAETRSDAELAALVAGLPAGEAVRVLLELPSSRAARALAAQRSGTLAALLVELVADPAGLRLLGTLPTPRFGRALETMPTAAAVQVVGALPPLEAARALAGTDARTAGGPLGGLPLAAAGRIVETLSVRVAAASLRYVHPDRIARLLHTMPEGRSRPLLRALDDPVRVQVERLL